MFSRLLVLTAIIMMSVIISACDSKDSSSAKSDKNAELFKTARMNGCIDCHRVEATVVGPSWKAIAERYKDAPREEARKLLIESTAKGSVGKYATWKGGQGMPPMEKRVAAETIELLVDYILDLNDTQKTP